MKSILVQEGKVYICEEVVANGKADMEIPYYFDLNDLIEATKKRMEHCVTQLQEAYNKQKVFKVGDCVIEYEGGYFNIPSYEAMKDNLKFLNKLQDNRYFNVAPNKLEELSLAQLNQLKKAFINHHQKWTLGASIIEEFEMYKLQLQARGEDK
jgi:hypothetical protein